MFWIQSSIQSVSTSLCVYVRKTFNNFCSQSFSYCPAVTDSWCYNVNTLMDDFLSHTLNRTPVQPFLQEYKSGKHNWIYTKISTWMFAEFLCSRQRLNIFREGRGTRRWLHFSHYFLGLVPENSGALQASSFLAKEWNRRWRQQRKSPAELHVQRAKLQENYKARLFTSMILYTLTPLAL